MTNWLILLYMLLLLYVASFYQNNYSVNLPNNYYSVILLKQCIYNALNNTTAVFILAKLNRNTGTCPFIDIVFPPTCFKNHFQVLKLKKISTKLETLLN